MYHAAKMDRRTSKITFIENAIGERYANIQIEQALGNNGGSFVTDHVRPGYSSVTSQTVLFSDVLDHIMLNVPQRRNLTVIIKIDIERQENTT